MPSAVAAKAMFVCAARCQEMRIELPHRDLAYLSAGTPEFGDYLWDLIWAQRFALANRAEMMDRFRAAEKAAAEKGLSFAEAVSTMTEYTFPEYREMMNNGGRSPIGNRSIKGGY